MSNVDGKILDIIMEIMETDGFGDVNRINAEARLREDLCFDSLALAVLTVKIESAFGVDVFEKGLVLTVQEIQDRIDSAS